MSGIRLKGTGSALPRQVVTNRDLQRIVETDDAWIVSRTGIRERRKCRDETQSSLAEAAARAAMEMAGIGPETVGVCLVPTITADYITPSTACVLQNRLGLPEDTVCFDLNAACSGFVYGLHTAQTLLAASPRKYGLVVCSEVLTRITNYADRGTCILFGDGAAAAVVEYGETYPPMPTVLGARGTWEILNGPGINRGAEPVLYMEGTAVFRFAVETVPRCMDQVLDRAGLALEDVDEFVFHQANRRILEHIRKKCGIPPEKVWMNMDRYGNVSSASTALALDEVVRAGRLGPGKRALCVAFGGGLTWGGALVEMGERT